jgi:hypothetical protein
LSSSGTPSAAAIAGGGSGEDLVAVDVGQSRGAEQPQVDLAQVGVRLVESSEPGPGAGVVGDHDQLRGTDLRRGWDLVRDLGGGIVPSTRSKIVAPILTPPA